MLCNLLVTASDSSARVAPDGGRSGMLKLQLVPDSYLSAIRQA